MDLSAAISLTEVNLIQWAAWVCSPMRWRDAFRVVEQSSFEEGEGTGVLERDDDGDVLFEEGEAGFSPLGFFGEVAVERDLAELVCLLLPPGCVGNLHRFCLFSTSLS